jgi:phage protein D
MAAPRRVYLEEFKGFTELEIVFSGRERPLNQQARVRSWPSTKVVDVVRQLAKENGFEGAFVHVDDPGDMFGHIAQAGETDAAFLQRLATQFAHEFCIDAEGLHWRKPQKSQAAVGTLRYGVPDGGILSLSFVSNLARHVGRVEVRGRDPMQRKTIISKTNHETTPRTTLAETIEVIDPERYESARQRDNAKAAVHPTAAASPEGAQAEASARFVEAEAGALEARLTEVGTPQHLARRLLHLEGVSAYLSGNYYIAEASHVIGAEGYVTELQLRRDGGGPRQGQAVARQGGMPNSAGAQSSDLTAPLEVIDPERYAATQEVLQ